MTVFFIKQLVNVALFRSLILIKQKILLFSVLLGMVLIPVVFSISLATYTHAEKIFWDLSLGSFFIIQLLLATYLSSHLFSEEKQNGGLYTLFSMGLSSLEWLWGNVLAIFGVFLLVNLLWCCLASLLVFLFFSVLPKMIVFQVVLLSSFELLVVLSMGVFFSLFFKALYSWVLTVVISLFLHSMPFIEQSMSLLNQEESFFAFFQKGLLLLFKLLPPLDWFNLRDFISFQDSYSWAYVCSVVALSFLWAIFWQSLSEIKFRKMDL